MPRLVLIVDDSETSAETLQIALEAIDDIHVRAVRTVKAAIAAVRDADVAAIITDFNMPQADGFALIRQLRAEPRFSALPILLISGDSDPCLPAHALENGADAFFAKPYSPAAVRRKLEQLLCAKVF